MPSGEIFERARPPRSRDFHDIDWLRRVGPQKAQKPLAERVGVPYARLYFHRLMELADGRKVRRGVLLGAMMAHEIGHLLLGVNSHSRGGIMSIPWDAHNLQQIDLRSLGFTPEQAATLKAEALRRADGLPEDVPLPSGETGLRRASQ